MPQRLLPIIQPCPLSAEARPQFGSSKHTHCSHCDAQVTELSNMSEAEVDAFMTEYSGEIRCIRQTLTPEPSGPRPPRVSTEASLSAVAIALSTAIACEPAGGGTQPDPCPSPPTEQQESDEVAAELVCEDRDGAPRFVLGGAMISGNYGRDGAASWAISAEELMAHAVYAPALRPPPEATLGDVATPGAPSQVRVAIEIGEGGRVRELELLDPLEPELASKLRRQIRRWRFRPLYRDGQKIRAATHLTIPLEASSVGHLVHG